MKTSTGNIKDRRDRGQEARPMVMVVDDDPVIGFVLAGALNRGGFQTEIFQDAVKALDAFDSLAPDLAVVDWVMPNLDGLSLIDRLKNRAPDLPTMLITSYSEHEEIQEARRSGRVNVILDKPFDLSDFLNKVSTCIKRPWPPPRKERLSQPGILSGWPALTGRGAYFEHILDSIIDAVIMVDRRGLIIYHNQGSERMFGFPSRADGRLSILDFCPPGNPLADIFNIFFSPHPPVQEQSEGYFLKTDGSKFYTIFSASLFQAGDHGSAVLLAVKDINDRHLQDERVSAEARQYERLALTDPLTGLYNRRYFDQRLEDEFKRLERYKSPLTLIMMDFDHFKNINDQFGHLVGDQVLRLGAEIMSRALRDADILSRWGGEEYMILLPETGEETGRAVARRLHQAISRTERWASLVATLKVTVSVGLLSLPWGASPPSCAQALEILDQALYRAKDGGRDRIVRYSGQNDDFIEGA